MTFYLIYINGLLIIQNNIIISYLWISVRLIFGWLEANEAEWLFMSQEVRGSNSDIPFFK